MNKFDFQIDVIKTDRKKSVSIQLEGELVKVRVPRSLSDERINSLIKKRIPWIKTKLKEYSQRPSVMPKKYVDGEIFPYLGKNYCLKVEVGDDLSIKMKNGYFLATIPETEADKSKQVKHLLIGWYQSHAKKHLKEKTNQLSELVGASPVSVSIKNYKSRWGSCSSSGVIDYNWRIILAPHFIIDYVVVHELCHLLEHNHSPKYWRIVEKITPNWKNYRDWLRHNSDILKHSI